MPKPPASRTIGETSASSREPAIPETSSHEPTQPRPKHQVHGQPHAQDIQLPEEHLPHTQQRPISPMFVKQTSPLGLTPFVPPRSIANKHRLPPLKNFARLANHKTVHPVAPEDELATFCLCNAKAKVIDADNGKYIQCYLRKCCKWFHRKCVGFEEAEDWRDGWVCHQCKLEADEALEVKEEVDEIACETEESDEIVVRVQKRKVKRKRAAR